MHRNSFKRFYDQDNIYYIVAKTQDNFPYFKEPIFCELLIEELKLCKELKMFKLYAFSIIYDHVNLLIQPGDKYNISKVMQFIKRHTTRNANYIMGYANENVYTVGEIGQSRLPVRKHINLIKKLQNNFTYKYGKAQNPFPPFQWQQSFYDHVIRNEKDFEAHLDYTIDNHIKHGLPEDWKYTSLDYVDLTDEC